MSICDATMRAKYRFARVLKNVEEAVLGAGGRSLRDSHPSETVRDEVQTSTTQSELNEHD